MTRRDQHHGTVTKYGCPFPREHVAVDPYPLPDSEEDRERLLIDLEAKRELQRQLVEVRTSEMNDALIKFERAKANREHAVHTKLETETYLRRLYHSIGRTPTKVEE